MGVGGVAGHVADDAQAARLSRQRLGVDEGRDLGGEVDAVDEDVRLNDLLVRTGLGGGLLDVPLDDVFETGADAEVDGTSAATTESTDDEDARVVAGLSLAFLDGLLHIVNEEVLVLVAGDAGKRLILAVLELPGPGQECESGTSEAGVVPECCNTASVLVLEELKVEKSPLALGEAAEDGVPTTLVLVAWELSVLLLEVIYDLRGIKTNSERIARAIVKSVKMIVSWSLLIQRTVCFRGKSSSGSSLRPMTMWSLGASVHEPVGTREAPVPSYSESGKMLNGDFSTLTV